MAIQNSDIARIFQEMGDLLDIEGANPFRVRAYRNAARSLSGFSREISEMVAAGEDLTELPGIGKDLAGKIEEIVRTGRSPQLEALEERLSPDLVEMMKLPGLGPKRVQVIYRRLGVSSLGELQEAAEKGRIRELEGFGAKIEAEILEGLKEHRGGERRLKLAEAEKRAEPLLRYLKAGEGMKNVIIAGSFRRRQETIGDLDILVTCRKDARVMERFVSYEDVRKVLSKGGTRSTVLLRSGLQVDLRVVPQVSYGAALHYFTGSKAHNIAVRKRAIQRGFKVNEYGVYKESKRIAGRTEQSVYESVGLPYIEPELRENRGELEAAEAGALPRLVRLSDIQGDLHSHTRDTDGQASLEEMAEAARRNGYAYLAVTDHSRRVSMAKGLDERRLADQMARIDALNARFKGFRLLKGIEVDILRDGSLDLPDEILRELDLVVASVHYDRALSRERQTARIIRAMDNPCVHILAHPTGRLIGERPPYEMDLEKVMQAALERGCFLELNACPDRLDLDDQACREAKGMGLRVAVSTDAHRASDLDFMRFGIDQARRGWLEPENVLNTLPWQSLRKALDRR